MLVISNSLHPHGYTHTHTHTHTHTRMSLLRDHSDLCTESFSIHSLLYVSSAYCSCHIVNRHWMFISTIHWFATSELVLRPWPGTLAFFLDASCPENRTAALGSLQSRPLSSHPPKDGETFSHFLPAPAGLPMRGFDFQGAVASEGWQRIWGRPSAVTQHDCPRVPKSWVLIR